MAPVALDPEVRYAPLAVVASHIATAIYLTYTICVGLYRSHHRLRPAQSTRSRTDRRLKLVPLFAALATIALLLAVRSGLRYAALSYGVWAHERGIGVRVLPQTFTNATETHPLYLGRWLADTPVYADAVEIVVEKARRFWWGQQLELGTVSWVTFLAVEGRGRKVPLLWAYTALARLVSLSFAQNLFYLALLLTPLPLPGDEPPPVAASTLSRLFGRVLPAKPEHWSPHPSILFASLFLNYGLVFSLPYVAGTSWFHTVVGCLRVLSFAPLVLPALVPASWGVVQTRAAGRRGEQSSLFRTMSVASMLLHGKATVAGLLYNLPDSHKHRHSIRIPFDTEERSTWERTTTSLGKVLGATADHPVVAAAGQDVMLCALSLGLWAAVCAVDVQGMLASALPWYGPVPDASTSESISHGKETAEDESSAQEAVTETPSIRRRGRPPKLKAGNAAQDDSTSTTVAAQTPKRGRGLPRKVKVDDPAEVPGDETYEPPAPRDEAAAEEEEGDVLLEEGLDCESASLAWGLVALGGLGAGCAAVYGGECVA